MKKLLISLMIVVITSGIAVAIPINGDNGIEGIGAFLGDFSFSATNDNTAQISLSLTNTSPVANGGYLVAFAFNNPSDLITGISLSSSTPSFGLLGSPGFNNSIPASPYADFDIGSSITSSWIGGGSPNGGIGVGVTESFTFVLSGNGFLGLSEQSFFSEGDPWFAARFKGFLDGGSDKVPGVPGRPTPVPEPATIFLLGMGLLGLLNCGKGKLKNK